MLLNGIDKEETLRKKRLTPSGRQNLAKAVGCKERPVWIKEAFGEDKIVAQTCTTFVVLNLDCLRDTIKNHNGNKPLGTSVCDALDCANSGRENHPNHREYHPRVRGPG